MKLTNTKVINFIKVSQRRATSLNTLMNPLLALWSNYELTEQQVYFIQLARNNYSN